jgi:cation transport regulator ChaB
MGKEQKMTIDEIPKTVSPLPSLAKHMWLRVYNRTIKTRKPETAVDAAWSIVKQFYKRHPGGKWRKIT